MSPDSEARRPLSRRLFALLLGVTFLVFYALGAPTALAQGYSPPITFFTVSDIHYNWPVKGKYGLQRLAIASMNATPGQAYPADIGGRVLSPRGVIVLGDLTDRPNNGAPAAWLRDFGLNGEGLLRFPVYEGLGNHDSSGAQMWAGLRARNQRRANLVAISKNGFHYAWNWGGVHFVMVNIFPGDQKDRDAKDSPNPHQALEFLRQDLRDRAGGMPVIILQHFDPRPSSWWTKRQVDAFYEAIKNYNVICIIHGHRHAPSVYRWRGIDVVDDGALKEKKPGFFVFHIQGNRLTAVQRHINGEWGKLRLEKTFSYKALVSK